MATTTTTTHGSRRSTPSETIASGASLIYMSATAFFCIFPKALTVTAMQFVSQVWAIPTVVYLALQIIPLLSPDRYHSVDDIWDSWTSRAAALGVVIILPLLWVGSMIFGSDGWWWPQYYVVIIWVPAALATIVDWSIAIATKRVAAKH